LVSSAIFLMAKSVFSKRCFPEIERINLSGIF